MRVQATPALELQQRLNVAIDKATFLHHELYDLADSVVQHTPERVKLEHAAHLVDAALSFLLAADEGAPLRARSKQS